MLAEAASNRGRSEYCGREGEIIDLAALDEIEKTNKKKEVMR